MRENYVAQASNKGSKPFNEIGPSVSAFDLLGPVVKAELILYC